MIIDWSSLLAGFSLAAAGGWLASLLALRKDERSVQLEQVTKERAKWRENMRTLAENIASTWVENSSSPSPAKVAALRARLNTSINPKDTTHDDVILAHFDELFSGTSTDLTLFVRRIALLLKHDWERVKWECTPLYLKPFQRFSGRQRAWRSSNYRDPEPSGRSGLPPMLQLRPNCECCNRDLPPESTEALICSFECTFCRSCSEHVLDGRCPNCGGELVARPRRTAEKLAKHPASTDRIFKLQGCEKVAM